MDINAYLEAFKEKKLRQKEREKQRQSQRKKAKRLDEYKAIEKALRQEKKEKANQIVQWHQQWLQSRKKQPIQPSYETASVGDFSEEKLYLTREELKQWEIKHYPCIDWLYWEELVQRVRKEIISS